MKLSDFHFDLPPELIATKPAQRRELARLMTLGPDGELSHRTIEALAEMVRPGDCWVVNNSRVIPARIHARLGTGGACELLLLEPAGDGEWEAMVRPARKLRPGTVLELPGGARVEIAGGGERTRRLRFELPEGLGLMDWLGEQGEVPLPPYILRQRRERGEALSQPEDRERYQTVYARTPGSVAAPTAGLHLTPGLMDAMRERGAEFREVTLHVGAGTFEPVTADAVAEHQMHREWFEISEENAASIEAARIDPARRIVAVGTTAARALEGCAALNGCVKGGCEHTQIFIYPGYRFRVVEGLLTNFHLPDSTLILLVSALIGREKLLHSYHEAITKGYRFFSYGDAMFIGQPL